MREIKTNMAGNVWKIHLAEGDKVKIGQEVVILESMKMEIPITSEVEGIVEEIVVEEGSFVDEDDVLFKVKSE